MGIDLNAARAQQRELNMVADEIQSVKHKLARHQESLIEAWQCAERKGIDNAIEDTIYRLNRLSRDLEELGHDVMVTAEEIKREEEAAERARRRAEESKKSKQGG